VQIQLNHEIDNMTEEMEEMRSENSELKGKLQHMAYEGVEYISDGDKEKSDDEIAEDADVLAQQRQVCCLLQCVVVCCSMLQRLAVDGDKHE